MDIGAESEQQVLEAGIEIGTVGSFHTPCRMLGSKRMVGKAFDDRSGRGVPTGVISIPCRYIHGPAAVLDIDDLIDTIRLITGFCRSE